MVRDKRAAHHSYGASMTFLYNQSKQFKGLCYAAKCNTNAKCNNIDANCNKVFNAKCKNVSDAQCNNAKCNNSRMT